jgi:hypothetical protein
MMPTTTPTNRHIRHEYNGEESDDDSMPSLYLPRIDIDTDSDSDDESCTTFPTVLYHHKDLLDEPNQQQTKDYCSINVPTQPAPPVLPWYIVCDVSPLENVSISERLQAPPPIGHKS